MKISLLPPNAQSAIAGPTGLPTVPFYQWMVNVQRYVESLESNGGGTSPPSGDYLPITSNIIGNDSIVTYGTLAQGIVTLVLDGDVQVAGNTQYYGSNASGVKGWFNVSDTLATTTLAKTVGTDGVTNLDLAVLANAGGGSLLKVNRDQYGRLAGTSAATTDDLSEGSTNLYFTSKRAKDAVGSALVSTPRISLTYNATTSQISADLVPIVNAGGGVMYRFSVNSYGQVTGWTTSSTDDLPEGINNLYFTKSRVAGSLIAGGGITLTVDGSGNTSIATTAQAGGVFLNDWSGNALTDWSGVQLMDWSSQTVYSFNGRKGDVLPASGDYQTIQVAPSEYTLATLPVASANKGRHVYCSNLVEGYAPLWSDGSNWRRFTDNSIAN